MKRYISLTILSVLCFVLQTTLLPYIQLAHVMPNLLLVLTAAAGFMYGRKAGMYTGVFCGILADFMYSRVIGIAIFIYALVGYINGMANKLYYKEDYMTPMLSIAVSDLLYNILYYGCHFLLRGRLNLGYYFSHIIIPEAIYTVIAGFFLYRFLRWLDDRISPREELILKKGPNDI